MACDCKASRQIYELGRKYGTTVGQTRKEILKSSIWQGIQYFFLTIFAILLSPILFCVIAYRALVKKETVVHIDRMVGLNRK